MNDYFVKMENILDQCVVGYFVSKEGLVIYMLVGLGFAYDPIVYNIMTCGTMD